MLRGTFLRTLLHKSGHALLASCLLLAVPAAHAAADIDTPAPDFQLPGSDGATHSLAALRGRHVVLAFFPKAFTGG